MFTTSSWLYFRSSRLNPVHERQLTHVKTSSRQFCWPFKSQETKSTFLPQSMNSTFQRFHDSSIIKYVQPHWEKRSEKIDGKRYFDTAMLNWQIHQKKINSSHTGLKFSITAVLHWTWVAKFQKCPAIYQTTTSLTFCAVPCMLINMAFVSQ